MAQNQPVKRGVSRRKGELQAALRELAFAREQEGGRRGAGVATAERDVARAKRALRRQTNVAGGRAALDEEGVEK